jgi:hypothetical protein
MPNKFMIENFKPKKYRRGGIVEWRVVKKAGVWFFIIILSGTSIAYKDIQWSHPYAYIEVVRIDGTSETYRIVKPDPSRPLSSEEIDSITHKIMARGRRATVAGYPVEMVSLQVSSDDITQSPVPAEPIIPVESVSAKSDAESVTTVPEDDVNIPDETDGLEKPTAAVPGEGDLHQIAAGLKVNSNVRSLLGLPEVARDAEKLWTDPQTSLTDLDPSTVALIGALASDNIASATLLRFGDSRLQALVLKANACAPPDRVMQPVKKMAFTTKVKHLFGFGKPEESRPRVALPGPKNKKLDAGSQNDPIPFKGPESRLAKAVPTEVDTPVPPARLDSREQSAEEPTQPLGRKSEHVKLDEGAQNTPAVPKPPRPQPMKLVENPEILRREDIAVSKPAKIMPHATDKDLTSLSPNTRKLVQLPEVRRDARRLKTNPELMLADLDPSTVALIGTLIMNRQDAMALLQSGDPDLQALVQKAKEYSSNA